VYTFFGPLCIYPLRTKREIEEIRGREFAVRDIRLAVITGIKNKFTAVKSLLVLLAKVHWNDENYFSIQCSPLFETSLPPGRFAGLNNLSLW
jgi:hypothetical protein